MDLKLLRFSNEIKIENDCNLEAALDKQGDIIEFNNISALESNKNVSNEVKASKIDISKFLQTQDKTKNQP
ncbi:hypothetical protein DAHU10_036700 [Hanseniaspora uvarum]|nr:hypothetical protein DAHU10_036700 [Hanseniaspora uvarum]